jgi:hypothetical protein
MGYQIQMRYFKLTQVDSITGISVNRETSKEGPRFSDLPGLNVLLQDNINSCFFYATVGQAAQPDPENQCWELTLQEFAAAIKINLDREIDRAREQLFEEERGLRRVYLQGKYDDTASIAGIYKYEQAKAYLAGDPGVKPVLETEASIRGVAVQVLAEKIVANHESFRNKEAIIAGLRGKQLDRINNFQFDAADPWGSWQEFFKLETIGTRTEQVFENGQMVDEEVPIQVRHYGPELGARYQVIEGG